MDAAQLLEQVIGPLGALVVLSIVLYFLYRLYVNKSAECDEERDRATAAEEKYVNLLKEEIQGWRERDKTLELISHAAAQNQKRTEE
jgi:hypothetical protein